MFQIRRRIIPHTRRQNRLFPGGRRQFQSLQLLNHTQDSVTSLELAINSDVLPRQQKAHKLHRRNRLDFSAHAPESETMDARQEHPIAPFNFSGRTGRWSEPATQNHPGSFKGQQCRLYPGRFNTQPVRQSGDGCRSDRFHPALNYSSERFFFR